MISIDLKDAYLSIPIDERDRRYLRLIWVNTTYEFQSPLRAQQCTKGFHEAAEARDGPPEQRGLRSMIFLYNMLLMGESRQDLQLQSQEVLSLLRLLGFRINWGKSQLTPSQQLTYLGLVTNTTLMSLTLPQVKVQKILKGCHSAPQRDRISVRDLSRLIGMMSATSYQPASLQNTPESEDKETEGGSALRGISTSEWQGQDGTAVVDNNAQQVE